MKLILEIQVKRLNINQVSKCDVGTLCFDFGRILGNNGGGDITEEINKLLPLIYAGL